MLTADCGSPVAHMFSGECCLVMLDYATIVTYVTPCWPQEAHRQSHKQAVWIRIQKQAVWIRVFKINAIRDCYVKRFAKPFSPFRDFQKSKRCNPISLFYRMCWLNIYFLKSKRCNPISLFYRMCWLNIYFQK